MKLSLAPHWSTIAVVAAAISTVAVTAPVHAQRPFLVKDIDTTGEPYYPDCVPSCQPPSNPLFGGHPRDLTPWGDLLAFVANDRSHGFEPWISDGTPGGTRLLVDLVPGADDSDTVVLGEAGGDLLLWSRSGGLGPCGLWRADRETFAVEPLGLEPGHLLAGANPDSCRAFPARPGLSVGGWLYFEVGLPSPDARTLLARSDATAGGTEILLEICGTGDPCNAGGPRVAVMEPDLVFAGTEDGLWRFPTPASEPELVADLPCVGSLTPAAGADFAPGLYFVSGCAERTFYHLYTEEPGLLGVDPIQTFETQQPGIYPEPAHLTVRGSSVYFRIRHLEHSPIRHGLWKTSGTPASTLPVATESLSRVSSVPAPALVGDRIVFEATPKEEEGSSLYALTPEDTVVRLIDEPVWLREIVSVGPRAFLSVESDRLGAEPWASDGTPEGTLLLADIAEGGSTPREPTVVGDLVFFAAETQELGRELWAVSLSELPAPPTPSDEWIESSAFPDFRFQVQILPEPLEILILGRNVPECQDDTVCVSGSVPGRPEVYLRVLGPRPNGFLWPSIIRFTPSRVQVWIEQESTGQVNFYDLPPVRAGNENLSGRQDRTGFLP